MQCSRVPFMMLFAFVVLSFASAQAQQMGTLYSPWKYRGQPVSFCLNFQSGLNNSENGLCDLRYGMMGIDDDFDWLQTSMAQESRNVIEDLGKHTWSDEFKIPVIAALSKLAPGEKRSVSIDVSGRDGDMGRPGERGAPAVLPTANSPGFIKIQADPIQGSARQEQKDLAKPERTPKIDPAIVKAIVGHMYVVHVVDDHSDYYALVRVDEIRNRSCSISWKLIPTPTE